MPDYFVFDVETSIAYDTIKIPLTGKNKGKFKVKRKKTMIENWKNPTNDVHTIIYGTNPNNVKLVHSKKGFNRKLPYRVGKKLLQTKCMIGTNLKFDLGYIWHDKYFQQWLRNGGEIWDCMQVQYILSAMRWKFASLGEMQERLLGKKTKLDSISRAYGRLIGANEIIAARHRCKRLWRDYEEYAIEDGKTPMLIMLKQYAIAKSMGVLPIVKLYNQYVLAITMMEVNGVPVDIPAVEALYREFSLMMVEYLEKAQELAKSYWTDPNLPPLNINSGQHSSAVLFGGDINVEVLRPTGEFVKTKNSPNFGKEKYKKFKEVVHVEGMGVNSMLSRLRKDGYYSADKEVVDIIYEKSKNPAAIEYCKYLKLAGAYKQKISTYLNAMLYRSVNGTISANYNTVKTATGRLSASAPNLQNIPAHGEFGASIPKLLIAPEGWTCANVDFSQLEVLCQAMLSKDPNLIRDIKAGIDFHIKRLNYIHPDKSYDDLIYLCKVLKDAIWCERRSQAKVISFQKAYGAGIESLAQITGLPVELVKEIFEKEDIEYPYVKEFDENLAREVSMSAIISRAEQVSKSDGTNAQDNKGVPRRYRGGIELLPIRNRDKVTYSFDQNEFRHVGFYRSPTGKIYSFMEFGSYKKDGGVYRYYKPTQMKNFAMQGTAGDIQATTTVALFQMLVRNPDKVKLVNEIHDSKWFIIKDEYLDCILSKICDIMRSTSSLLKKRFNIDVPFDFECEAKIGRNFADMQVWEKKE